MLPKLEDDPVDTSVVVGMDPNPVPPTKHTTLHFLFYLLVGITIFSAIFLFILVLAMRYYHIGIRALIGSATISSQSVSTPTPTLAPKTITWNTYTNSTYHYSIMYPSDWTAVEQTSTGTILYPPGSVDYANLTQNDIGGGIGPQIIITVITRPFVTPDYTNTTVKTDKEVTGYVYNAPGKNETTPTIDFPLGQNILEFTLNNIGQSTIDSFLANHKSKLNIKDIDLAIFEKIAKSFTSVK